MDQEPEQLRYEIAQTRRGMSNTLEAIGDHVSPGRIIERRKNRMMGALSGARDRVMGSATQAGERVGEDVKDLPHSVAVQTQGSPLGAGLVAFGLGFVAAAVFPPSSREKQMAGQLMAEAEPLKDELMATGKEMVEDLKAPAQSSVETLKERAADAVDEVKTSAQDAAETVKDTVRQDAPSGQPTGTAGDVGEAQFGVRREP